MKMMNEKGDLLDVVARGTIYKGNVCFSERYKLIGIVKQGDLQYDFINNAARGGFWLLFRWGTQSMPQPLHKMAQGLFWKFGSYTIPSRNSFLEQEFSLMADPVVILIPMQTKHCCCQKCIMTEPLIFNLLFNG